MRDFWEHLVDFLAIAAIYGFFLRPGWRRRGRRVWMANAAMLIYLTAVFYVTLMPILTALPFCWNHPYVPMHMRPFEDLILRRGDCVRQVILNVGMLIPFGILLPICRQNGGKRCGLLRCLFTTAALSVGIELLQPLLHGARSSDVTDVITNTAGGLLGYGIYALGRVLTVRHGGGNRPSRETAV